MREVVCEHGEQVVDRKYWKRDSLPFQRIPRRGKAVRWEVRWPFTARSQRSVTGDGVGPGGTRPTNSTEHVRQVGWVKMGQV